MGRTKSRNAKIELIRVVACFLVILNHIMIVPTSGDGRFFHGTATLVAIIWTDVPLFLLISGFLMFQNQEQLNDLWESYRHKLKNFLIYVFIPSCIIVVISGMIAPFLIEGKTFAQLLAEGNLHLECIKNYIFMQQTSSMYSLFWYIWVYAKVIVFFPLLAFVCQDTKDKSRVRRFLMLLSAGNQLFIDLQGATQKSIGNFDNIFLDKYFLYILLGYEMYLLTQTFDIKKIRIYGIVTLVGSVLATILVEHVTFYRFGTEYMPGIFTVTASVGMFLLLYSLREPRLSKMWNYLGKSTLYIYMVHIIVIFSCEKIWGKFLWNLFGAGSNVLWLILFDAVYGAIIFALSLAVGILFKWCYEKIILFVLMKLGSVVKGIGKGSNE